MRPETHFVDQAVSEFKRPVSAPPLPPVLGFNRCATTPGHTTDVYESVCLDTDVNVMRYRGGIIVPDPPSLWVPGGQNLLSITENKVTIVPRTHTQNSLAYVNPCCPGIFFYLGK